ncbi:hypothetical protein [Microbacterium caowuchunii]|uniref:Lipoprotein n=1 Tax=Microbacterium caowuchunii TaxID=2614638 RepID=A0A5N0TPG4_9MICO|nr:hypothetical protein [Microbacterium caowuchunii]KAA9136128.1 hypothetical protein F6B40_00265 [Microbacterium caowuchunii]
MSLHDSRPARTGTVALLASFAALTVGLSGCSVVDELVYHQRSATFQTSADAPDSSVAHAGWVPKDASDIRIVESTRPDATNASILLSSASPLDPGICVEIDRQSGSTYSIEGAPDPYAAERVFTCGEWSVIPSEDGWFGWTPNSPDEQDQAPSRG